MYGINRQKTYLGRFINTYFFQSKFTHFHIRKVADLWSIFIKLYLFNLLNLHKYYWSDFWTLILARETLLQDVFQLASEHINVFLKSLYLILYLISYHYSFSNSLQVAFPRKKLKTNINISSIIEISICIDIIKWKTVLYK